MNVIFYTQKIPHKFAKFSLIFHSITAFQAISSFSNVIIYILLHFFNFIPFRRKKAFLYTFKSKKSKAKNIRRNTLHLSKKTNVASHSARRRYMPIFILIPNNIPPKLCAGIIFMHNIPINEEIRLRSPLPLPFR